MVALSVQGCAIQSTEDPAMYDVVYGASNNEFPRFPADSSHLFSSVWISQLFTGLVEINNINEIDTSGVEDMSCMFSDCSSLSSLDLSGWDTSSVTNMSSMFQWCSGLTSLVGLSTWNRGAPTSHTYGQVTELPIPTRDGYRFAGWYDEQGNWMTSLEDAAGRKLHARWAKLDGPASTGATGMAAVVTALALALAGAGVALAGLRRRPMC